MYWHLDPHERRLTPDETRSAWLRAEVRATARLRHLERRRARRRRLVAIVTRRKTGAVPAAAPCETAAGAM